MDFSTQDSPELILYRQEVGAWLDHSAPPEVRLPDPPARPGPDLAAWARGFQAALADQGWAAPSWPRAYGGGGLTAEHDRVVQQERTARGIPDWYEGSFQTARAVLSGGSDGQRLRFVRPLLRGDAVAWYPPAGADLLVDPDAATVQADRDGDVYMLSGATLLAGALDRPDFLWVLAITDREEPRSRRLSAFLVPAGLEGITLTPVDSLADRAEYGALFADVAVPVEYRIGNEGDGLRIAQQQYQPDADADRSLERQRVVVGRLVQFVRDVLKGQQPADRYRKVRGLVAQAYINVSVLRVLSLRNRWVRSQGESTYQGVQYAALAQSLQDQLDGTLLETLGPFALLGDADLAPIGGGFEAFSRETLAGSGGDVNLRQQLLAVSLGLPDASDQPRPYPEPEATEDPFGDPE